MPKFMSNIEDFELGDWYIDWCTGIKGYYSGPHQIYDLEKFEDDWIVSWGMIEKVDKNHPELPLPKELL